MSTFDVHGLAVETCSTTPVDPGAMLLAAFPPGGGGVEPALRIDVAEGAVPVAGAMEGPPVLVHGEVRVHADAEGATVRGPGTAVRVDASGTRIEASVPSGRALDVRSFVDLELRIALVLALRPRGLVHLHAAAARLPDGRTLLIAGTGGAGKSTLVAALAAAGASYLGDDAVFLAPDGGLRAFPRPFHLSPEAARAVSAPSGGTVMTSGKLDVDPLTAFPGRLCWRSGPPAVVLFPQIENTRETVVEPLPAPEALARLLATSAFAATRLRWAATQRERLAHLVGATRQVRVRLGRDLLSGAVATANRIAAQL